MVLVGRRKGVEFVWWRGNAVGRRRELWLGMLGVAKRLIVGGDTREFRVLGARWLVVDRSYRSSVLVEERTRTYRG